jgi:hypothetical protein
VLPPPLLLLVPLVPLPLLLALVLPVPPELLVVVVPLVLVLPLVVVVPPLLLPEVPEVVLLPLELVLPLVPELLLLVVVPPSLPPVPKGCEPWEEPLHAALIMSGSRPRRHKGERFERKTRVCIGDAMLSQGGFPAGYEAALLRCSSDAKDFCSRRKP